MIGAIGHIALFAVGLMYSVIAPTPEPADPRLTLRGWLIERAVKDRAFTTKDQRISDQEQIMKQTRRR
jgi:hypothetical protein